mgnify:CR=1 FL=1
MGDREDTQRRTIGPLGIGAALFAACVVLIPLVFLRIPVNSSSSHLSSATGIIRSIDIERSRASLTDHDPAEFPFRDEPVLFEVPEGHLGQEGFEVGDPVDVTFFYTSPPKEPLECVAMEIATDLNSASVT